MACFPSFIVLKTGRISAAQGPLVGSEFGLLDGAVPTRQREIIAGRVLARRAMAEIGHPELEVGQSLNGAPIWPSGLCGSIAHSASHAAVAIASTSQVRSVGIDIDDGRNLGDAKSHIGQPDEIKALATHPLVSNDEDAVRLLFSAKEALFKCQSPVTKDEGLGFMDVRLESSDEEGVLTAVPIASLDQKVAAAIATIRIIIEPFQHLTIALAWLGSRKNTV
jgi:4'-phosphopantetheinyl transferase EntD